MRPAIPLRMPGAVLSVRASQSPPPPQAANPPEAPPAPPVQPVQPAPDAEWMRAQQAKMQQACKVLESAAARVALRCTHGV